MTLQLARMTNGTEVFITKMNCRSNFGQNFMTGMTKTAMPHRRVGDSGEGVSSRKAKGVQRPRAIAPDDQPPRLQSLHRTASGIKFDRTIVIRGELANRNKILNKLR